MSSLCIVALLAAAGLDETRHGMIADQARLILGAERCQLELPAADVESARQREVPAFLRRLSGAVPSRTPGLEKGISTLFLIVVGLAGLVGLFLLVVRLLGIQTERMPAAPPAPPCTPAAETAAVPAWDALAREGRFAEALRSLLAVAFADLLAHAIVAIGPASTNRELLGQKPMPEHIRTPLASLVFAVEKSIFGGVPIDATEFEAAVGAYGRIRAALEER